MSDFFEPNLQALARRFPEIAQRLGVRDEGSSEVQSKVSSEGMIVAVREQPLDHPSHPHQAAQQWAIRACGSLQSRSDPVIVFGFGGGYHLEALIDEGVSDLAVYEPSWDVLRVAMESRDLRRVIDRLEAMWVDEMPRNLSGDRQLMTRSLSQTVFPEAWEELRRGLYAARGSEKLKPSVSILGPLQGGTLPILSYVQSALVRLGIRARPLNMSPWAAGYHQVGTLIEDKFRQQVAERNYVDFLSSVAVESVTHRPVDIFICLAQAPITIKALQQLRSMGIITVLWFVEDFRRFSYWQPFAPYFDFVFTIQKEPCISAMKQAGAPQVHYLPVACDPLVHSPMSLTPEEQRRWGSPVSFVGAGYHNRQQVFASLSHLPFKIWGTEWPVSRPFNNLVQEEGRRLAPEEYTKIFNATDININLHSSSERDGVDPFGDFVNPRTFELAAAGAFQLVDQRTLLPELFVPGEELITFNSVPELKDQIAMYLSEPDKRLQSVRKGRERALNDHTYDTRMRQMLSVIYSTKYAHLAERQKNHPWTKLLAASKPFPELLKRLERGYSRGDDPSLDSLIAEISVGKGKLDDLDQELLFLHHVKQNMVLKKPGEG
jgi:spore maturation protein CgeB